MQLGMHLMLRAGNISAAVAMDEKVAPFIHPKMSSSDMIQPLPEDLASDPPPQPDEPGPESPVL
jgi:hypothetical protein